MRGHYKQEENGNWIYADETKVIFNKDYELSEMTHQDASYPIDGWYWYEEAPQDYIEWYNSISNDVKMDGED